MCCRTCHLLRTYFSPRNIESHLLHNTLNFLYLCVHVRSPRLAQNTFLYKYLMQTSVFFISTLFNLRTPVPPRLATNQPTNHCADSHVAHSLAIRSAQHATQRNAGLRDHLRWLHNERSGNSEVLRRRRRRSGRRVQRSRTAGRIHHVAVRHVPDVADRRAQSERVPIGGEERWRTFRPFRSIRSLYPEPVESN